MLSEGAEYVPESSCFPSVEAAPVQAVGWHGLEFPLKFWCSLCRNKGWWELVFQSCTPFLHPSCTHSRRGEDWMRARWTDVQVEAWGKPPSGAFKVSRPPNSNPVFLPASPGCKWENLDGSGVNLSSKTKTDQLDCRRQEAHPFWSCP